MSKFINVVITGSNRGIGFETAKGLLLMGKKKYRVVLTYRSERDFGDSYSRLMKTKKIAENQILGCQLDITDSNSIVKFIQYIKENVPEGIDVLVNNAGVIWYKNNLASAVGNLDVNFYGTVNFTNKMLYSVMNDSYKVISVSSQASACNSMNDELKKKFLNVEKMEDLHALVNEMVEIVKKDGVKKKSFVSKYGKWSQYTYYSVSKLALNGFMKYMAFKDKNVQKRGGLFANCCPGWCSTRMGTKSAPKTPEEGSKTPVWLVEKASGDKFNGGCFSDMKKVVW